MPGEVGWRQRLRSMPRRSTSLLPLPRDPEVSLGLSGGRREGASGTMNCTLVSWIDWRGRMAADDFITMAIARGQSAGPGQLSADERFVFLLSEVEVHCDMDGIDSLLDEHSVAELAECAAAFADVGAVEIATTLRRILEALPDREEALLSRADTLIRDRAGYDSDAIRMAIGRRLAGHT